jgi:DNA-binding NtrC family response regulator
MRKEEVLVNDDNQMTGETSKLLLEDQDFTVPDFANGILALDLTPGKNVAIYLTDYRFEGMKEMQWRQMIRKLSPQIYIVGFSHKSKQQESLRSERTNSFLKTVLIKVHSIN